MKAPPCEGAGGLMPWEISALSPPVGLVPGTSVPAIYDRVVSIRRLKTVAAETPAFGATGYSGAEQTTTSLEGETIILTGLPATIQVKSGRSKGPLPADVVYRPEWLIKIPSTTVSQYSIRDRDIVDDDEGYRYAVFAAWWSTFGYQLSTIRLEA